MEQNQAISTIESQPSNSINALIIEAKYSMKIKKLNPLEAGRKITESIRYWHACLGLSQTNSTTTLTTTVIKDFFLNHMNYISTDDMNLAIKCAMEKKFDCDLNLYNKTFSADFMASIIKKYLDYRNTLKDTKIINKNLQLAEKTKPTDREIAENNDKFFKSAFEEFLKNGWFEDSGNTLHELLVEFRKIDPLSHTKYIEQGVSVLRGKKNVLNAKNSVQILEYRKFIEKLELGGCDSDVVIMAKKICLNEFFKAKKDKLCQIFSV